jgi:glycosyltransferase involved in cell wall biosynthesis
MKILLAHNTYRQPGGEDVVFDQECQLLARAGHEVVIYRKSNREIESYSPFGRLGLAKRAVWASDTRLEVRQMLAEQKPDLVHVHNTLFMISPSIYSACREAHVPVVQTLHNYRLLCPAATFFRGGQICRECVEHSLWRGVRYGCYRDSRPATAAVALALKLHRGSRSWVRTVDCIALTAFARQRFIDGGLPADRIAVKPNFVDPDPGERIEDGLYAAFVGRLSPEKGVSTLVAAWKHLGNRIPLVVLGDGPLRTVIESEAARQGLSSISFHGQVTCEEVRKTLKGARFLVVPSECYENFPMIIVEAFACGTPVVCSRVGAMQELVEHNRTGLHFRLGDAQDLAATIEWAWTHRHRVAEMGREARREYQRKYTAERNYNLLFEIYARARERNSSLQ